MTDKYILEGHTPVRASSLIAWATWFEEANRTVAKTAITPSVEVSTVFLGLDYNFEGYGEPILFETMVFGGALDQEQARYRTWDEASVGHISMVKHAKDAEAGLIAEEAPGV